MLGFKGIVCMVDLVTRFLSEESDAVPLALEALKPDKLRVKQELNFNLFDIEIDFESNLVKIFDVCDTNNEQRLSISDFSKQLIKYKT